MYAARVGGGGGGTWPTSESITIHKNDGKGVFVNIRHWPMIRVCIHAMLGQRGYILDALTMMQNTGISHNLEKSWGKRVICNILPEVEFSRQVIWWEQRLVFSFELNKRLFNLF